MTIEELETLASAGFDIVELGMTGDMPLCMAPASPRPGAAQPRLRRPSRFDPVR